MTWAPWAVDFLADPGLRKLLRKANQIGGSTALAADCVHEIRGTNPYRPRLFGGPVNVVWSGVSLEQMYQPGGVVHKLWQMLPPDEIHAKVRFVPGKGIVGTKYPHIPFVDGPGRGSNIILRTYQQDPQTFAGMTLHHAYGDEPMPLGLYAELNPRLWKHHGRMTIGFTPTPDMPEMGWLRRLVDDAVFAQHHVPMTEAACWPAGYARPFYSAADIERMRQETPAAQRPMRFEAAWEPLITDRWLSAFSRDLHVRDFGLHTIPQPNLVVVATDHGLQPGKQVSVLVVVANWQSPQPRAWVVDEHQPGGSHNLRDHARGIIEMLARNGLGYDDVDRWVGDQDTRDRKLVSQRGNADLKRALALVLGRDPEDLGWIKRPSKYRGSVLDGLEAINAMLARSTPAAPAFTIHAQCPKAATACERFRGRTDDPHKDILDAIRYAVMEAVDGQDLIPVRARY